MKSSILGFFFIFFPALSVFCGGNTELVNTQEIDLNNIFDVKIIYSSENISLFMGTTDKLIIKEYMSEDNSKYYAGISKSGNTVTIKNGQWPFRLFFNSFNRRLEVYIPLSYKNTINIKASSGKIESSAELFCSNLIIENSSGGITINAITADTVNIKTTSGGIKLGTISGEVSTKSSSGSIRSQKITGNVNISSSSGSVVFGNINGNVSAEASSGRIALSLVNGSVNAKTTSGSINCTVVENARDVLLISSSGSVTLNIPRSFIFNFSSRTSSGSLRTPFSDKLYSPVNDRSITQGFIGSNNGLENIPTVNIRTNSGSIKIDWV
jgi:DUF4097 and DUF4098 domain-containing protein YvlB